MGTILRKNWKTLNNMIHDVGWGGAEGFEYLIRSPCVEGRREAVRPPRAELLRDSHPPDGPGEKGEGQPPNTPLFGAGAPTGPIG